MDWNGAETNWTDPGSSTNIHGITAPVCSNGECTMGNNVLGAWVDYPNVKYHPSYQIKVCTLNSGGVPAWVGKTISGNTHAPDYVANVQAIYKYDADFNNATCGNVDPCLTKKDQPIYQDGQNYPVLTKLPYHAAYYQTVGVCIDSCVAKPVGPVILDQYASDNSGYTVGPFNFTGAQCTETTATPPPQPTPDEVCDNTRNACEAQCSGKSYQHNCEAGTCECFGAPSYNTDPPAEPTTPTADPGSPAVPSPQTAASDPGGDAQASAQISNQAKQLGQGDAQLAQLGAVNSKLGAVVSNQAKQLGQGDKILDYQRQQLGVSKDGNSKLDNINEKLDEMLNPEVPNLPEYGEIDGSLGDAKQWDEYDNVVEVGQERAGREIAIAESQKLETPLTFGFTTNGMSPVLSGQMMGKNIEIRFDRPWMETGYDIMHGIFIGLGYLQAFLMINSTFTKR